MTRGHTRTIGEGANFIGFRLPWQPIKPQLTLFWPVFWGMGGEFEGLLWKKENAQTGCCMEGLPHIIIFTATL